MAAEAFAGDEARLDLSGVEPAPVLGCVVDFEAAPEVATFEGAEDGSRRLERMGIQVVLGR